LHGEAVSGLTAAVKDQYVLELCTREALQFACVVLSALAFGATHEQIDVLQTAIKAKGVSEQIRQMLDEAARMADLSWEDLPFEP